MNKSAKGKARELECRKIWEAEGWITDFKVRSRFTSDDLFTHFDFVAIKGACTALVQVKSNASDFYKSRKEIAEWLKANRLTIPCEVWVRENHKDWRASKVVAEGYEDMALDRSVCFVYSRDI